MDWNRYGGGLAKFDGVNWTVYNTSNSVCLMTMLGNSHRWTREKWIGTVEGLQSLMV
jgi:hypothetical protein